MLRFAITDALSGHELCQFSASWATSVPLFRDVAAGYFRRIVGVDALLFYVAIDGDGPWLLVCGADRKASASYGVELTAGPLLLSASPPSLH